MTAAGGKGMGSVVNMLKRSGKKRDRKTYNAQIQATVTEAEPDVNVVTAPPVPVTQIVENPAVQLDVPVRVIEGGENSSTKKRKADKQIIIEDDTGGGVGETDDNPIYCPPWNLRSKDEVTTTKQVEEFLYNGLLLKYKGKMKALTDAVVANGFLTQKYQNIMFDVEMLQRMSQLMRVNRALRTSNEKAKGKIKDLQASVTKVNEEMEKMKKTEADMEEQLKTWKKKYEDEVSTHQKNMEVLNLWKSEAERLQQRYEDKEGKINTATVKAMLNDALKDASFGWLFDRLARPLAGETAAVLEETIQKKDPTFVLPKGFERLAAESKDNVFPWQGGEYDLEELLAPPSEEEENSEGENEAEGDNAVMNDVPPSIG